MSQKMFNIIKRVIKFVYDKVTMSQTQKELNRACSICECKDSHQKLNVLKEIYRNTQIDHIIDNDLSCEAICFSKDRAMQLHALLLSYYKYVKNPVKISVLYTCTSERHEKSYEELIRLFENFEISFIKEHHFKNDLDELMDKMKSNKCFFMTDDALFIGDLDLNDFVKYNPLVAIPSLTKGLDLTYCFSFARIQMLPNFIEKQEVHLPQRCWRWSDVSDSPDWAYPLSLDATLFNKNEASVILKQTQYKAPNTLEGNIQIYLDLFINRLGICFEKVKYVNVPCNMVQTEHVNKTTGEFDAAFLLQQWEDGNRIYFEEYYKQDCKIVQKARYNFVKR